MFLLPAFGSVGLITSGLGRDLDQVHAIKYPVFTKGASCSHAYSHILDVGVPVHVGGVTISNGDLLHGDLNGITRIPLEIAAEIPGVAAEFMAAERIILDYVRSSEPKVVAELSARREEFSAVIAKLANRLRRSN